MASWTLPPYRDLPQAGNTGDRHAWGVFGQGDQLGAINLLTPEKVKQAVALVHKGQVFNLSLPLNVPNPPFSKERRTYRHHVFMPTRNSKDDNVDDFFMQASSQWDGLRHMRYREFGYYGGRQEQDLEKGALGIDRWADHGLVGRGIVLDMGRFMERRRTPLDYARDTMFDAPLLEEALRSERVRTEPGDILVLRTGWLGYFLSRSPAEQARFPRHLAGDGALCTPGLKATPDTAEWLWDHGFCAVVADNPAVEDTPGTPENGFLHRRLIPLLGMALGELFVLDALAADCAAGGAYECMVVGVPLNLPGGVGSPANAIAIR